MSWLHFSLWLNKIPLCMYVGYIIIIHLRNSKFFLWIQRRLQLLEDEKPKERLWSWRPSPGNVSKGRVIHSSCFRAVGPVGTDKAADPTIGLSREWNPLFGIDSVIWALFVHTPNPLQSEKWEDAQIVWDSSNWSFYIPMGDATSPRWKFIWKQFRYLKFKLY